jgi:hypothetical protein
MFLHLVLIVLHVTAAAVLFGAPLGIVGACRRALATGSRDAIRQAAAEGQRRGLIASICGLLTLVTGIGLIFERGGFKQVAPNFHMALGVMLLAVLFSVLWMKPAASRLVAATEPDPVDRAAFNKQLGRLGMGSGIMHAIWLGLLVLMFVRFGDA